MHFCEKKTWEHFQIDRKCINNLLFFTSGKSNLNTSRVQNGHTLWRLFSVRQNETKIDISKLSVTYFCDWDLKTGMEYMLDHSLYIIYGVENVKVPSPILAITSDMPLFIYKFGSESVIFSCNFVQMRPFSLSFRSCENTLQNILNIFASTIQKHVLLNCVFNFGVFSRNEFLMFFFETFISASILQKMYTLVSKSGILLVGLYSLEI